MTIASQHHRGLVITDNSIFIPRQALCFGRFINPFVLQKPSHIPLRRKPSLFKNLRPPHNRPRPKSIFALRACNPRAAMPLKQPVQQNTVNLFEISLRLTLSTLLPRFGVLSNNSQTNFNQKNTILRGSLEISMLILLLQSNNSQTNISWRADISAASYDGRSATLLFLASCSKVERLK